MMNFDLAFFFLGLQMIAHVTPIGTLPLVSQASSPIGFAGKR